MRDEHISLQLIMNVNVRLWYRREYNSDICYCLEGGYQTDQFTEIRGESPALGRGGYQYWSQQRTI